MSFATVGSMILGAGMLVVGQEEQGARRQDTVIACNPKAIGAEQRPRYGALTKSLRSAARDLKELPDGYVIRLDGKSINLAETAEWMSLERLCCPFLKFELSTSGNQSDWTLRLTGPTGVKAILEAEFGPRSK